MTMAEPPAERLAPVKEAKRSPAIRVKERKLLKGIIAGKTATQAAKDAGWSDASAGVMASRKMAEPGMKAELQKMMDEAGLSRQAIIQKIREGADAKKVSYFAHEGVVKDQREDVDHVTRHRFLETARKVRGDMGEDENEKGSITVAVMVNLIAAEAQRRGLPL